MYIFLAEVIQSVLAETIHSVHFLAETIQNVECTLLSRGPEYTLLSRDHTECTLLSRGHTECTCTPLSRGPTECVRSIQSVHFVA